MNKGRILGLPKDYTLSESAVGIYSLYWRGEFLSNFDNNQKNAAIEYAKQHSTSGEENE